jgi:hypothetical protein
MASKLSREELVELVRRLLEAEGTDEEQHRWLTLVRENVPHPGVSDLIYYPEVQLTAEEIVETALAYKPIKLPSSFEDQSGE